MYERIKNLFSWWVPFNSYPKGWSEADEIEYQKWARAKGDPRGAFK